MSFSKLKTIRNHKRRQSETIAYVLLLSGIIALLTSIVTSLSILAFTGLSLTFWGALLLYIKPTKYVKVNLLNSITSSLLISLNQIITDLDYKGQAIYLPPKFLNDPKSGRLFISSKKGVIIPSIEEINEEKVLIKNPKGILLIPPGLDLANLYEMELGKAFRKIKLDHLRNILPKLFVENLEIAQDLEINLENNFIKVRIKGLINKNLCHATKELQNICGSIGCPICSSIAIALSRATEIPITIDKIATSEYKEDVEITFRLLEAPPSKERIARARQLGEIIALYKNPLLLSNLVSVLLTVFGITFLAWVGWLTWLDVTVWGKDLAFIFFGPRIGEFMSLGIGIRAIHYLLIGLVLFFSGLFIFLQKRARSKLF
ncbi:MAG: hypothetical protein ACFFBD_12505 [Candidatus Hodarchaeota archaeon]